MGTGSAQPARIGPDYDWQWPLHFSFDMLLRLYFSQGCVTIEHPDLPEEEYKPSIWRLPFMALFRALEGFMVISFGQGLLGANSPKPTQLLSLNLPSLRRSLHEHHLIKDSPKRSSIGKLADGSWSTGYLKKYICPPCAEHWRRNSSRGSKARSSTGAWSWTTHF